MKLPLKIGIAGKIRDADGQPVGHNQADYIVNAVNAHARLVEALELAKLGMEAMIEEERCGKTFLASALSLDKINAALAAAKGDSHD